MPDISRWIIPTSEKDSYQPRIFDLADGNDEKEFIELGEKGGVQHVIDDYNEQLREYFHIMHPGSLSGASFEGAFSEYLKELTDTGNHRSFSRHGRWVYYSWSSTLVHVLEEEAFHRTRTARNRNLITETEQQKFYDATVGIAGLSVGNSAALMIAVQGGARHMKLADHDALALSNMNRIRGGVESLGLSKAVMTARQIYALNPYAEVDIFPKGLSDETLETFFKDLDIVIDEIDDLGMKYRLREHAKEGRLPLLTAADNGDGIVMDVERYDLSPQPEFFHGRMGKVNYETLSKLDKMGIGKMITKWVGAENVTARMQESLKEIGKTVVSWPQVGGAAALAGSALAYGVRRIANGQTLEASRALISFDAHLVPGFMSPHEVELRKKTTEEFQRAFGL